MLFPRWGGEGQPDDLKKICRPRAVNFFLDPLGVRRPKKWETLSVLARSRLDPSTPSVSRILRIRWVIDPTETGTE